MNNEIIEQAVCDIGCISRLFPIHEGDVAVIAAAMAFLAAIAAFLGVKTQWDISKRQHTYNHLSQKDSDKDMIEAKKKFIELANAETGLVAFASKNKEGHEDVEKIRLVLNEIELMAIGIQKGIIDFELVERYKKSEILKTWERAAPFIYAIRARTSAPSIYHEFEELARVLNKNKLPPKRFLGLKIFY